MWPVIDFTAVISGFPAWAPKTWPIAWASASSLRSVPVPCSITRSMSSDFTPASRCAPTSASATPATSGAVTWYPSQLT